MAKSKSIVRVSQNNEDNRRTKLISWLGKRLGVKILKTTPKSVSYIFQPEPIVRKPLFDYVNLFEVACTSWILRRAFGAIIRESTRNGIKRIAKFKHKCTVCGAEYQQKINDGKCTVVDEKGKVCGGKLRQPSQKEYNKFEELIKHPNPDYSFDDFINSTFFYSLSLDDFYWGVAYKDEPRLRRDDKGQVTIDVDEKTKQVNMDHVPAELYIEDARFIFPVADEYGHLGGTTFFCPNCYDLIEGDQPIVVVPLDYASGNVVIPEEERKRLLTCPYCNGEMKQTAYVQEVSGNVVARFTKDEIVHGSTSRVLPELFGNSRIISVWTIIQTILAMDGYNYEVYSEGKVGALLGFEGYDQLEIDKIKNSVEEEIKRLDQKDITTGRFKSSKKIRTLMVGLKSTKQGGTPVSRIPLMEDLKSMQSIEFYNIYTRAIDGVYGVTSEFVSGSEGGQTRYKIEVDSRTYKAEQTNFCKVFNNEILPKWGINDWKLVFIPSEPKDKFKEAQTQQTLAAAAFTWLRGGFAVTLGPDGALVVEGEGKIPEGQQDQGFGARADEAPKPMNGKPWRYEYGSPTRTQGEQPSDMSKSMVGIPISWHSLTQIRLWDRVYAIDQENDEVYVTVNDKEVKGTRTKAINFTSIVASLGEYLIDFIGRKLGKNKQFNATSFEEGKNKAVNSLRRGTFEGLISLSNYLDDIEESAIAFKIDNLRMRLERVIHDALDVQSPAGEMLENTEKIEKEAINTPSITPYAPKHYEDTMANKLNKIIQDTKTKKQFNKAVKEAEQVIEDSYNKLKETSLNRAKRRTGKKDIKLSPEEEKRLTMYKNEALEDFKTILNDKLKVKGK